MKIIVNTAPPINLKIADRGPQGIQGPEGPLGPPGPPGTGELRWGDLIGTLSDQTDLQAELDAKANLNHNHNTDYYLKTEFINVSVGNADSGKPIILNNQGQIDSSMLDVSTFYYVGPFTPEASQEYPDTTGESHGAFWVVQGLPGDYTFIGGDLVGQIVNDGDFMVWASSGWSIMSGEMNPSLYYKLDGTQALTWHFAAGNYKITNMQNGTDPKDGINKSQLDAQTHTESDITDLDKYTKAEVDSALSHKLGIDEKAADSNLLDGLHSDAFSIAGHKHTESDITDLDKYTTAEVDGFLLDKADTGHTHVEANITDLDKYTKAEVDSALAGKADTSHEHTESDITDLDKYTKAEVDNLVATKESDLGTPTTDDQVLSSKVDGTRAWINLPDGSQPIVWGAITGTLSDQDDLQLELDAKSNTGHTHVEANITDLDKYTTAEVDSALAGKSDISHNHDGAYLDFDGKAVDSELLDGLDSAEFARASHNHNTDYYLKTEFLNTSAGVGDAGKPIILDSHGQIDPSMLDVSVFYYVGSFTPEAALEYPDPSGESYGAFWVVQGVDDTLGYEFTGGDLAGKTVTNGDFMVWSAAGWSIMAGEMNPILYYRLDGSQPITADFQADGFLLKSVGNGVAATDAVNKGQLDTKADTGHTHVEANITDLDKYTKAEVDGLVNAKEDDLDVPTTDGQVLSSLVDGTRSWINLPDGSQPIVWGAITGTLSDQDDLQLELDAKSNVSHNHDTEYLAIDGIAVNSALLNGKADTAFALAGHNHDTDYLAIDGVAANSLLLNGKADTEFAPTVHNHDADYLAIDGQAADSALLNGLASSAFEPDLGDPDTDGFILSSLIDGTRSWIAPPSGGGSINWGDILGTLSNQTDLQDELDAKSNTGHGHVEADISDLDKYTMAEVDSALAGKADTGHNHNTDYYLKTEFLDTSAGVGDAGKPIVLDSHGQIDPSMLDVSVFYYVGTFTPATGAEYPDTTGESYGAFWVVQSLASEYTFEGGDLVGKAINNGDFMVWAASGWSIMAGEMNPVLYYRLDGSQPITADFQADGNLLKAVGDGVAATDGINKGQLDSQTHVEADITDLDKYTRAEVDTALTTKLDTSGKAADTELFDGRDSSTFAPTATVSTDPPSGGSDGDVWYQI